MKNNFLDLFNKCPDELKNLALTHSSFAHDHKIESNERLEFLGDSVLSIIVSDYLYKHLKKDEGKMSKIRSTFVCTENLAKIAQKLGIEKQIKIGKSFKDSSISEAILADTIESIIGAIYLTYGLPSISSAVLDLLDLKTELKKGIKPHDFKSELQEYCQAQKIELDYKVEKYKLENGQENFRASSFINGKFLAYGNGSTKREAEQNAAHLALEKLKKEK